MHLRSALALTLLAAVSAHADITMEMKMESPYQNGTTLTRIKGDKMRTDLGDTVTSYIDITTGDQVTVIHATKTVTRMSGAEIRAGVEESKKAMAKLGGAAAVAANAPRFFPTGKEEKIGPYSAAVFTRTVQDAVTTVYIAKNFPNYAALKPELSVLNKLPGQEADANLDGILVKSVTEVAGTKTTMTLVSLKQAPLDAALFVPPADQGAKLEK
jgi:hypothetical protein